MPMLAFDRGRGFYFADRDKAEANVLMHYRVGGEKTGIRRWQNKDGSYTSEGYQHYKEMYGWGEKKDRSRANPDLEAEVKELQVMERVDAINSRKNITSKEKKFVSRIVNGEALNDSELPQLKELSEKHFRDNIKLNKQRIKLLKKNDAWSNIKDESEFPEQDRKDLNSIHQKMHDNRKAYADMEYMVALALDNKYRDEIKNETDTDYIDPSFRTFSSKEEKAAAESAYIERIWYCDDALKMGDKWKRELEHLTNRVWSLSIDGNEGVPKSISIQSMYNYIDSPTAYDDYNNWQPKYEETSAWKSLENEEQKAIKNRPKSTRDDQYDAYVEKMNEIRIKKRALEKEFYPKITEQCLRDIGYEVTPKNVELITDLIWWD